MSDRNRKLDESSTGQKSARTGEDSPMQSGSATDGEAERDRQDENDASAESRPRGTTEDPDRTL